MAVSLPDEILSEILTPALCVPDDLFSDTSTAQSPFVTRTESTSAILLVCKDWLRVSTPLLYHVVVLRSTPQAQALAVALKKNPDLGRFIKQLRVEGGFGLSMHHILKSAPHITDIFLSLHLHSSESSAGLVLGLPLINPKRIIFWDDEDNLLRNKNVANLLSALETCAKKWSNLATIVFTYDVVSQSTRREFVMAICNAPNVKAVSFPLIFPWIGPDPQIYEIADIPSIQTIELRGEIDLVLAQRLESKFRTDYQARLKMLLKWTDIRKQKPVAAGLVKQSALDPFFCPMAACLQAVVDLVWGRVLSFAMGIAERPVQQLRYLLVSKTFKRLALPHLYKFPVISHSRGLYAFIDRLAADPSLGLHVCELEIRNGMFLRISPTDVHPSPIFAHTPRLRRLTGPNGVGMEWSVFKALAETAGSTLVEFTGFSIHHSKDSPGVPDPSVFLSLTALQLLEWNSNSWKADVHFSDPGENILRTALPSLEFLESKKGSALYPVLMQMELPNLLRIDIGYSDDAVSHLLAKHGAKIRELKVRTNEVNRVVALCPNMVTLRMDVWFSPNLTFDLSYPSAHQSLEKFVVEKDIAHLKADDEAEWERFFLLINPANYPALREIQLLQCVWPATEHAISKSLWVKWAEYMLKKGIKITDPAGMHWRPRLKANARR
ncbi:hypothetical protein C8R44DRAFT_725474 [Mycena epipterygia]|nr:hypothetical protein C8R44DRAFT_725474 [Mycena epipterygia]